MQWEESRQLCLSFGRLCAMKNSSPAGWIRVSFRDSTSAAESARILRAERRLPACTETSPSSRRHWLTRVTSAMRRLAINRFTRVNGRSRAELRVYLANQGAEVLSAVSRGIFIEPRDRGFFESSF